MLGGFWATVGVVAFKSFWHVVHTVVQGTKLGDEIEEQSWREQIGHQSPISIATSEIGPTWRFLVL